MSYYDTIEEDLERAREILAKGKLSFNDISEELSPTLRLELVERSGTIYGADIYPAYKLLQSFVEEIERLNLELKKRTIQDLYNNPALYDVARKVMHEAGFPWTDPRTGITHPPPEKS